MAFRKSFHRSGLPEPQKVYGAMHPRAIDERNGNRAEPIGIRRTAIKAARKARIATGIATLPHVRQYSLEPLGIASEIILTVARAAKASDNFFPLEIRTVGQIGAANGGQRPIDAVTDPIVEHNKGTMGTAGFPGLHMIARRHGEIGRPSDLLA